jgi:hypothetical protein
MSLGFVDSSAYRSTRPRRTLLLALRPARLTAILCAFLGVLCLGAAAWSWFDHCTADVIHQKWTHDTCMSSMSEEHETGPLTVSKLIGAWLPGGAPDGGVVITRVYWGARWEPMLFFVMALVAFAGPRLAPESATLTLGERDERVIISRRRFGMTDCVSRPLGTLREAVVLKREEGRAVQLVFEDGERIEVAAPTRDDTAQVTLARSVNDFIAPRTV